MEAYRNRLLLKGFHIFLNLEEETKLTKLSKYSNVPLSTCQKTIDKFCDNGLIKKIKKGKETNIEFTIKGQTLKNKILILKSILFTI